MLGQSDPVHFGHDDVRQQQVEAAIREQRQRSGAAIDGHNLVARVFQRAGKVCAHYIVVFSKQDADHRVRFRVHWQAPATGIDLAECVYSLMGVNNLASNLQ